MADSFKGVAAHVPPQQHVEDDFPIVHEGDVPSIDLETWDLRVWGAVEAERRFSWKDLQALPQTRLQTALHCVTGWSKLDNQWEGVRFVDLLEAIGLRPEAAYVMAYGHLGDEAMGYGANLPLEVLRDEDVILAHRHNGRPLTPDHGWPLRLVVPKRYAWKSIKWLRGLEFLSQDRRGYWESRGYHANGDPFAEERYATREQPFILMHRHGSDDS